MRVKAEGSEMLLRLMSAATMRGDVLANNIASQSMPGYRRRDVVFEETLRNAIEKGSNQRELDALRPEIEIDFDREPRADGNNVSPEEERTMLRENRLRYELYAAMLSGRARLISQAINSTT